MFKRKYKRSEWMKGLLWAGNISKRVWVKLMTGKSWKKEKSGDLHFVEGR